MSSIRLLPKLLYTAFHPAQQGTQARLWNGDARWAHGGLDSLEKAGEFVQGRASAVHQRVFEFRFGLFADETNKFHENETQTR